MAGLLFVVVSLNVAFLNQQMNAVNRTHRLQSVKVEENRVAIDDCLTPASEMVARVMPSVVSIEIGGFINQLTGEPSIIMGSGVVIDNGVILTCGHLIKYLDNIGSSGCVEFCNGSKFLIKSFVYDANFDLAVIKLELGANAPPVVLVEQNSVKVGNPVFAIGCPFGFKFSVSGGVISNVFDTYWGHGSVQVDAPINHGNSGGPVFDCYGGLVGIAVSIFPGPVSAGVNFIVGPDQIREALPGLMEELNERP